MSCYKPKRKTASGVEEVTLPIASIQGLQTELDDLGNKTIDRVDYLSVMAPEPAMQFYNTDAGAHIGEEGIAYNTLCEISSDINDSEVTYTFPMSTHIPILPGENISFSDNEEGTAIKINASPAMPIIRVGSVTDINGTMLIGGENPLIFTVEIIDGHLQVGDEVQICTRQLFTYDSGRRRKIRLRKQWYTVITEENMNHRFIFVSAGHSADDNARRLFRTNSASPSTKTLSALYVRVRRPVFDSGGTEVDGLFSNIVTVWKRYNRETGKIYIK